jgi:hypothetical protein
MNLVTAWQNFYVIAGSAGGALVGIQFVVITLIATLRKQADLDSIGAFGTPTVVHFGTALTVAAIMCAPWPSLVGPSAMLALCGIGGVIYAAVAFGRTRRQKDYQPVAEDWVWYFVIPCGLYGVLILAGLLLAAATQINLFVIGGTTFALLLVGIRNAWDSVTHVVVTGLAESTAKSE